MSTLDLNIKQLAHALGGEIAGGDVLAPGPGHSAADRSLSVKLDASAPDGFVVHSFSGDDPIACRDHVRTRCGLPAFKTNGGTRPRATSQEIAELFARATQAQREESPRRRPQIQLMTTFGYTDAAGVLLYQVLRYEPKSFRQRRPDGNGGWIWKLDEQRVLYRLPELLRYPDGAVFVTEGEKDADRVASLGHCATTVASGRWDGVDIEPLRGRDVLILQDMDAAGGKRATEAATVLHDVAKTLRVVLLPELTGHQNNKDVSDWLDADPRRAERLVDVCFDAPLWKPDNATTASHEAEPCSPPPTTELPRLAFTNPSSWEGMPVTDREWIVPTRMPTGGVTLLSGDGGVGKTILALQLSVAIALGRDWLNTMPDPGPVMVVCCEDDADELHRRYFQIINHYGARFADLASLHVLSLAGENALLAAPSIRGGVIQPTKLFARLQQSVHDIRPRLIVLDNAADIYGGNENDRAQVRQFITLLRSLVVRADSGVLLTSHPSLTGMSSGTGLSGSTAWNASVRSRIYLRRVTTEKDEEPDPDLRMIEVMKSNYGPVGETVIIRWKDGVFVPEPGKGSLEQLARDQAMDELFLKLLDRFNEQGRNVSHTKTSNTYAPNLFAADPAGKGKRKELAAAMERLFAAGKIRVENYGRPSRPCSRLVRC